MERRTQLKDKADTPVFAAPYRRHRVTACRWEAPSSPKGLRPALALSFQSQPEVKPKTQANTVKLVGRNRIYP
eukprot:1394569-Amorphochlora_amoeboformis.AAC.3